MRVSGDCAHGFLPHGTNIHRIRRDVCLLGNISGESRRTHLNCLAGGRQFRAGKGRMGHGNTINYPHPGNRENGRGCACHLRRWQVRALLSSIFVCHVSAGSSDAGVRRRELVSDQAEIVALRLGDVTLHRLAQLRVDFVGDGHDADQQDAEIDAGEVLLQAVEDADLQHA
jgi:hypothetical protein